MFPIDHTMIDWIIEWSAWSLNYFSVCRDGRTPYECLKGRRFRVPVAEFGEKAHHKFQSKKWKKERKIRAQNWPDFSGSSFPGLFAFVLYVINFLKSLSRVHIFGRVMSLVS